MIGGLYAPQARKTATLQCISPVTGHHAAANISFVQQRYGKRLEQHQLPPLFLILSQLAIFMKSLSMALQERTIRYMSYGMKHKIYGLGLGRLRSTSNVWSP